MTTTLEFTRRIAYRSRGTSEALSLKAIGTISHYFYDFNALTNATRCLNRYLHQSHFRCKAAMLNIDKDCDFALFDASMIEKMRPRTRPEYSSAFDAIGV